MSPVLGHVITHQPEPDTGFLDYYFLGRKHGVVAELGAGEGERDT